MRLSVRDGLKMKRTACLPQSPRVHTQPTFLPTTHYFSGNSDDTQLLEISLTAYCYTAWLTPQGDRKKINLLFKQGETSVCFSDQIKLRSLCFGAPQLPTAHQLLLLYRKENSALDRHCRHNVCLSRLYISRQSTVLPQHPSPCTGILTCFLFDHWETLCTNGPLLTLSDWS